MANVLHQLNMAATAITPWVDIRKYAAASIQTDCEDIASPVGVITIESSNDVATIEAELYAGTAPASTAAKLIATPVVPAGALWATGYDGVGSKASIGTPSVAFAFLRVKYTRTSGGAGDTLSVRWNLQERLGRQ